MVSFALVISGILNIVFAAINIKNTYKLYRNNESAYLRKFMKVLKLGAIPYFMLNFILYLLLFMLFFAASRGIIMFSPIPLMFLIPVFFTYLSVLFTSLYGMGFAFAMQKEQKMKTGKLIIHILLQLCFVLDVLDTLILLKNYKIEQVVNKDTIKQ